jgi:hypothetical protein
VYGATRSAAPGGPQWGLLGRVVSGGYANLLHFPLYSLFQLSRIGVFAPLPPGGGGGFLGAAPPYPGV